MNTNPITIPHTTRLRTVTSASAATLLAVGLLGAAAPADASTSEDSAAAASTETPPPYNPHLRFGFEWGNGSRVVGDQLVLSDDAQPMTSKQLKNKRVYKVKTSSFVATLTDGTPVISRSGRPYTLDSKGKAHPYFSGALKAESNATFRPQGNTLISPLGDGTGRVRIFRGPGKPVTTVTLSSEANSMTLYDNSVYWDRVNDKTKRWQVLSTDLSSGKTAVEANDAMEPSAVDDGGMAVVKMQHDGKADGSYARPIRGVQLLDGLGSWVVRRHGTWPVNDHEQVIPTINKSVIVISAPTKKTDTRGATVIDLNNHKAWSVESDGGTQNEKASANLAGWQFSRSVSDTDSPSMGLVLNTEKNALSEVRSSNLGSFDTWALNGRALSYSYPASESKDTVVTGRLR